MVDKKLGATGEFPGGKIDEDDEGELKLAVGVKGDKVIIDFGTPVMWVGMTPQEAANFASMIIKCAREAAKRNKVVLTVNI